MIRKVLISLLAIAGFFFLLLTPHSHATAIPEKCFDIQLKSLDGSVHKLTEFKGKPTILVFWASWCPHCRKEMPQLKELYQEENGEINIVAVAMDKDINKLKSYLEELKPEFPVFTRNEKLPECLGEIRGVPTLFVLDENLSFIKKFEGETPNEEIKEALGKGTCGCL